MALGDDSSASYIHMAFILCDELTRPIYTGKLTSWYSKLAFVSELVQHLIERCMTFGMSMEECMETLSKRADVQPVITSTVWKELEKENKEFFDKYKQWRSEKGAVSRS